MSNGKITFEEVLKAIVKLDGKVVGEIRPVDFRNDNPFVRIGWQYFPKGSKTGGEIFEHRNECNQSLYDMGND